MAYWSANKNKIIYSPAEKKKNGWYVVDCGCCHGIQWGGDEPKECDRCGGSGHIWWHKKSKVFAEYPGGKFTGKGDLTPLELNGNMREV